MVFALLPFCPFALAPALASSGRLSRLSREDIFVVVFTFRFMCRYRQLSWCYSRLHRWQLWPPILGDKIWLCPFWLQTLKLYLNIWRVGGGGEVNFPNVSVTQRRLTTSSKRSLSTRWTIHRRWKILQNRRNSFIHYEWGLEKEVHSWIDGHGDVGRQGAGDGEQRHLL